MKSNLKEYQSATQNRKSCVPGSANIKKILQFTKAHLQKLVSSLWSTCMVTALLCMITERCSFYSNKGWTSPVPMKRIPQPVPDPENPTHFKSVNETPTTTEKGNLKCQMIFNHM